jgi:hypothetical protein
MAPSLPQLSWSISLSFRALRITTSFSTLTQLEITRDQYRAMIMIATTMSAATSERARSSISDLGFGAVSSEDMAHFGGCSSPVNQPTALDFMGSDAMAICSR